MDLSDVFVVTGASGFIGRAVVAALARRGEEVLGASRRAFDCNPPAKAIRVRTYAELKPPTPDSVLVHLAEPGNIAAADAEGETYAADRSATLARLLAHDWSFVVYGSSAAVYGDEGRLPHRADEAVTPKGGYARAKVACERTVLAAGGAVARVANVYGRGMAPNTVLADILRQIPGNGPLILRDVNPVRDYLWIDDVGEGFVLLGLSRKRGIFNFGSGQGISAGDLARLALNCAGEIARPVRASNTVKGASHLVLDFEATTKALGWSPQMPINRGVSAMISGAQ